MSLKVRLARGGRKSDPHYYVVVANSMSARDSNFIEKIGYYHPKIKDESSFLLKEDRLLYWLSVGAKPTERITKTMRHRYTALSKFYKEPAISDKKHGKSKKELKRIAEEKVIENKKRQEAKKVDASASQ